MTDTSQVFLQKSRNLLVMDYLPKIERCLDHLSVEEVWARPNEASNSIGNLLLHLCGNVTQWILGGIGSSETSVDENTSGIASRSSTSARLSPRGNCWNVYGVSSTRQTKSSADWMRRPWRAHAGFSVMT
jgi:hypothetical protein